jgi:hypothetical protein
VQEFWKCVPSLGGRIGRDRDMAPLNLILLGEGQDGGRIRAGAPVGDLGCAGTRVAAHFDKMPSINLLMYATDAPRVGSVRPLQTLRDLR